MKNLREVWAFFTAYISSQIIRDIINNYINLNSIGKIFVLAVFAIPIYYLTLRLYNNRKIMRLINVSLAVLTIILSAVSILFPKNLYLYPIGFILLGIFNLLSGLSCIKEGEKLICRFLIVTAIIAFAAAAAEFYIM